MRLLMFLTLAIFSLGLGAQAAPSPDDGYAVTITEKDFSDGKIDGRYFEMKLPGQTIAEDTGDGEHQMAMKLITNPDSGNDNFFRVKYQYIDPKFETGYMPSDETKARFSQAKFCIDLYFDECLESYFAIYDYNKSALNLVRFTPDGSAIFLNGGTVSYEKGKWYTFTFYTDFQNNSYSAYMNDIKVVKNSPIVKSGTNKTGIFSYQFYIGRTAENSFVYIDNIKYLVPDIAADTPFLTSWGEGEYRINYVSRVTEETVTDEQTNGEPYFKDNYESGGANSASYDGKGVKEYCFAEYDPMDDYGKIFRFYNYIEGENGFSDSFYMTNYKLINENYTEQMLSGEALDKASRILYEADVYMPYRSKAALQLMFHYSNLQRAGVNVLSFDDNGYVSSVGSAYANIASYEPGKWYSYKFYADCVADTVTIWRDGVLLAKDIPLGRDYAYSMSFRVGFSGKVHERRKAIEMDNICVRPAIINVTTTNKPKYESLRLTAASFSGDTLNRSAYTDVENLSDIMYKMISVPIEIADEENETLYYALGTYGEEKTSRDGMTRIK